MRLPDTKPWLVVDDRVVRAREGDSGAFTPDRLFAVVVLWEETPAKTSWIGWLTTTKHQSVCFCAADLENEGFRQWLAALPGWEPNRMAQALGVPGIHLVWRRPQ